MLFSLAPPGMPEYHKKKFTLIERKLNEAFTNDVKEHAFTNKNYLASIAFY